MTAAFYTLGCKVNQNETGALEAMFRAAGYHIVPPGEAADVFVVNSCAVTAAGEQKSLRALRRARRQNPAVVTVLTGCVPQAFPQTAAAAGADVVSGTARRAHLLDDVACFLETRAAVVDIAPMARGEAFEELPAGLLPGRTRAFVKVQDGCDRRCAYCIIPAARGPARSRGLGSVLGEAAALAGGGHAELVLTGINLSSYGRRGGDGLAALVEAVAGVPGVRRIRLSSLEPDLLDDEAIARLAAVDKLCPHFHLSLQSGSESVLRRMRRPYSPAAYAAVAEKLRRALPGASLTTDVIVGFPGESEAEFEESLAFVRQMRFLKVHVFPFSAREGTPAAGFAGQLPKALKAARAAALQAEADALRAQWIAAQAGTRHEVLLEAPLPDGRFTGYTGSYIPVAAALPGGQPGQVLTGRLGPWGGERADFIVQAQGPPAQLL